MSSKTDIAVYRLCILTLAVLLGGIVMGLFVWFPYTYMGMGEKYFEFLPPVWRHPPFWDCFWLSFLLMQFRNILGRVVIKKKKKVLR